MASSIQTPRCEIVQLSDTHGQPYDLTESLAMANAWAAERESITALVDELITRETAAKWAGPYDTATQRFYEFVLSELTQYRANPVKLAILGTNFIRSLSYEGVQAAHRAAEWQIRERVGNDLCDLLGLPR